MNSAHYRLLLFFSICMSSGVTAKAYGQFEPATCSNHALNASTPSEDFIPISGGSVVYHRQTGLEWQRCAVGMSWDGQSCIGAHSVYSWEYALEAPHGWRVPNINELRSIVEDCRSNPAINPVVFPNTPNTGFWSSTPTTGASAWAVGFNYGHSSKSIKYGKSGRRALRLVRTR